MRYMLIVLVSLSLLGAPMVANADDGMRPAKLMRMLGEWMKKAGAKITATDNTVEPTIIEGKGNTVFNIEKIELTIEVDDVKIDESSRVVNKGDKVITKGGSEIMHHVLEMLSEKMRNHGEPHHPPITVAPGGMHGMAEIHGKHEMHEMMRGDMHGMHGMPDMLSEFHRDEFEMVPPREMHDGGMRIPEFHGDPARKEIIKMFQMIPPEVDPGFIEFIMHVGELAWKHPQFRERLEVMVEKAHEHLD